MRAAGQFFRALANLYKLPGHIVIKERFGVSLKGRKIGSNRMIKQAMNAEPLLFQAK